MRGKLHIAAGVCAGVAAAAAMNMGTIDLAGTGFAGSVVFAACTAVGTLFPDIDIPSSMIGHVFGPVSGLIHHVFGHRGLFHTPFLYILFCIGMAGAFGMSGIVWAGLLGFLYGVCIHLLQDMMTEGGIMLFFPWRKKISLVHVPSGHWSNTVSTAVLVLILARGWWL
ncbi:MAG: metal-dependent hydrolase [Clostridiales bacterium]|nr:metal-dependent hydrolase [Clostridiales bacterium]